MEPVIRIAAALIDDGEGALLLVRKRGTLAFMQAGGKIDPGETALDALVRELDEELLIAPAPGDLRPLGSFSAEEAERLPLAPLTRRHVLPLARALRGPR